MLWDKEKKTIVNNESSEITKMFNFEFNNFAKHPDVNLYPAHLKSNIEQVNSWTYNSINNGVYRCGFATKQKPYEEVYLHFQELVLGLECQSRLFLDFMPFYSRFAANFISSFCIVVLTYEHLNV